MLTLRSLLLASLVLFLPLLGFGMERGDGFNCSSFNGLTDDPCISKTVILALNDSQNSSVDADKRHRPGRRVFRGGGFPFGFYSWGFYPWGFYPYYGYGYPGYFILGDIDQDNQSGDEGKDGLDGR